MQISSLLTLLVTALPLPKKRQVLRSWITRNLFLAKELRTKTSKILKSSLRFWNSVRSSHNLKKTGSKETIETWLRSLKRMQATQLSKNYLSLHLSITSTRRVWTILRSLSSFPFWSTFCQAWLTFHISSFKMKKKKRKIWSYQWLKSFHKLSQPFLQHISSSLNSIRFMTKASKDNLEMDGRLFGTTSTSFLFSW